MSERGWETTSDTYLYLVVGVRRGEKGLSRGLVRGRDTRVILSD